MLRSLLHSKAFRRPQRQFTYQALSRSVGRCLKTVRRAVQALKEIHWINTEQKNRLAPIQFTLDHPRVAYCRAEIAKLEERFKRAPYRGQEIVVAMTTFLLEPVKYQVDTGLSILPNPETNLLLRVDLYIEQYNLAIEFQGAQHSHPTDFSTAAEVAQQQKRDAIKAQLLRDNQDKTDRVDGRGSFLPNDPGEAARAGAVAGSARPGAYRPLSGGERPEISDFHPTIPGAAGKRVKT